MRERERAEILERERVKCCVIFDDVLASRYLLCNISLILMWYLARFARGFGGQRSDGLGDGFRVVRGRERYEEIWH